MKKLYIKLARSYSDEKSTGCSKTIMSVCELGNHQPGREQEVGIRRIEELLMAAAKEAISGAQDSD